MSILDKVSKGIHSAGNSVQNGFNKVGHSIEDAAPREMTEESKYKKLPLVHGFQAGDVLLVKYFGMESKPGPNIIRGGQLLFSPADGSANSCHALIMVSPSKTAEAKSHGGVVSLAVDERPHTVYRCRDPRLSHEAAFVAQRLAGLDHVVTPGKYDFKGCANAPFWSRHPGKRCHAWLQHLYDITYSNKPGQCPSMFCSEFVSACYEVAAVRVGTKVLGIDPQGMSVKALEDELDHHKSLFTRIGRYPA